jgi:1-acyl-sn-glycerol-3-phosphate acyltransferase
VPIVYPALKSVLRPALDRGLEWVIDGLERIPEQGPVLLAANHVAHLDALLLGYVAELRGRRARVLAKAELFSVPLAGSILRAVGHIPAGSRKGSSESTLAAAEEVLAAGGCVAMFPEGKISRDLEPQTAHTGVARLARAAGVPVLPVGLWGSHRIWGKGRLPHPRRGVAEVVAIGAPVAVEPGDEPRAAADRIMAAICAQVSRARELYPQRPAPGEASWWSLSPDTPRLRSCRDDAGGGQASTPDL